MFNDPLGICKVTSTGRISFYRALLYIAVCLPVLSEAAPTPERQDASKCVGTNCTEAIDHSGRPLSFFQESGADRHRDVVELFSPVAPKSEPVPKNDTKAKSNDSNDYALLHWLFPAITFFIGFLIGYEPTGRDKIKSPNV